MLKRKYDTPGQDLAKAKIAALESKLNAQLLARDLNDDDPQLGKDIKATKKELKQQKQGLVRKQKNATYQSQYRLKIRKQLQSVASASSLTVGLREQPGRPRLEEDQPELLNVIKEIAIHGSATHDRRRTDEIRSCRTVSDLQKALELRGYSISRSATYLRCLPKCSRTNQGKRHVVTVPVRFVKAKNDLHKSHPDSKFCTSTIRNGESLASLLGPDQVGFISQDDKSRIALGITAAKEQGPLLMHTEYRVTLPDHDWVVGKKHKLIPSVYAGIQINPGIGNPEAVSYSGPTYVAIRSGKHCSSTAATHAHDFHRLMELDIFESILKTKDGQVKPVLIVTADGGPDENPRQVLNSVCFLFNGFYLNLPVKIHKIFSVCSGTGRL